MCLRADETEPSTEEKLLELGFQLDRTAMVRQREEKVQVKAGKEGQ